MPPPSRKKIIKKTKPVVAEEPVEKKIVKPRPTPAKVVNVPPPSLPIAGDGPPPLRAGEGLEHLQRFSPEYVVTFDAGAFDWVWRLVEGRALRHHTQPVSMPAQLIQREVAARAATSFRLAAGHMQARSDALANAPRKKLMRRRV